MPRKYYPTGNSKTRIAFNESWFVMDLGSGHNPHPRADILADRFLLDNTERSGLPVVLSASKSFVVADGAVLPFKDKAFDFVICSHVVEHVDRIDDFCSELNRVANAGYTESPSKFAEMLRHHPNHRWYVSNRRGTLFFSPTPTGYPFGLVGKLFVSFYVYGTRQVIGRDVFPFAHGAAKPLHYFFKLIRKVLTNSWRTFKFVTYTRLAWHGNFRWQVHTNN